MKHRCKTWSVTCTRDRNFSHNTGSPDASRKSPGESGDFISKSSKRKPLVGLFGLTTAIALLQTACFRPASLEPVLPQYSATPFSVDAPLGLPAIESPVSNPLTAEKVALGKQLFFDKNLSADRSLSCASCHDPERGWSNGQPVAAGVHGTLGTRNVPTIFNVALHRVQFWDGRATSLERQALGPILNPVEMAMPSAGAVLKRIHENDDYTRMFSAAFPDGVTINNVARSLAAFERTILAGNAPFDRFEAGDEQALSGAAKRGWEIFQQKGKCIKCHKPPNFTDISYHNIGVGFSGKPPDPGRYAVTKLKSNFGSFKSPTLRQLTKTAPYMHDGSMATIEEVVDYYDKGGNPNPQLSSEMKPLRLTKEEKRDLVQFLVEGLSSQEEPAAAGNHDSSF